MPLDQKFEFRYLNPNHQVFVVQSISSLGFGTPLAAKARADAPKCQVFTSELPFLFNGTVPTLLGRLGGVCWQDGTVQKQTGSTVAQRCAQ